MLVEPAPAGRRDSAFPAAMGKYVPFARLGSGGMADVFLSVAPGPIGFNKLAVIKRLRNPDDGAHVEMFLDEARLAARLNHPNIVHTYDVGESNGKYFIAMEYVEGQTLHALVTRLAAQSDGLSEKLAAYIAAQALRGLHHAHELCDFDGAPIGIVHRDVSPQNIYITYGGEVKVLDFGIAKARMNAAHTETGILKGKVRYMAPEHVGESDVDRRADIFAFGVVLWEVLARRPLLQGDAASIMIRVVNEDAPPARSVRSEVSPELDAIALKALKRDRSDRYPTADAMRSALEDVLGDTGIRAAEKELGRIMNSVFAQTRDEVRGRIKGVLDRLPKDGAKADSVDAGRPSELPALLDASGVMMNTPSRTADTVVPTVMHASTPRWLGLLLAVAGSVAAVVTVGRLGPHVREAVSTGAAAKSVAPLQAHARLETTPPGALLERDGEPGLRTPAEFDLEPGERSLRITLDGYAPETIVVDVQPGASIQRSLTLHELALPDAAAPLRAGTAPRPLLPRPAPTTPHATASAMPTAAPSAPPRIKIRVLDDSDSP